jgi:DNA-directed RNA polymerase specialized sigma24 family protein
LASSLGSLLPEVVQTRPYRDRVLRSYGRDEIQLEACFEHRLPPPEGFLRWLIENPDQMTWPQDGKKKRRFGANTQEWRAKLLGKSETGVSAAQQEARRELERCGAARSWRKWWAFEGYTSLDCCLETDRLVLAIEGKRTDVLSRSIDWYSHRNQLVRNLEVTQQAAQGRDFALIVIAEEEIEPVTDDMFEKSLPHLSPDEQMGLRRHYLGCVLWRDVCQATGIPYSSLPDTVEEAVSKL